jgi:hypothetical protein
MMKNTRSSSFITTVKTLDSSKITMSRTIISEANAGLRAKGHNYRYRLFIRPRLGKNNPNRALYSKFGQLWRWSSQDIKREHGTRFDLYMYKRYI